MESITRQYIHDDIQLEGASDPAGSVGSRGQRSVYARMR
jgi:hypothetical protein